MAPHSSWWPPTSIGGGKNVGFYPPASTGGMPGGLLEPKIPPSPPTQAQKKGGFGVGTRGGGRRLPGAATSPCTASCAHTSHQSIPTLPRLHASQKPKKKGFKGKTLRESPQRGFTLPGGSLKKRGVSPGRCPCRLPPRFVPFFLPHAAAGGLENAEAMQEGGGFRILGDPTGWIGACCNWGGSQRPPPEPPCPGMPVGSLLEGADLGPHFMGWRTVAVAPQQRPCKRGVHFFFLWGGVCEGGCASARCSRHGHARETRVGCAGVGWGRAAGAQNTVPHQYVPIAPECAHRLAPVCAHHITPVCAHRTSISPSHQYAPITSHHYAPIGVPPITALSPHHTPIPPPQIPAHEAGNVQLPPPRWDIRAG